MKQVVVDEHLDKLEVHPPGLYQRLVDVCVASAKELPEVRPAVISTKTEDGRKRKKGDGRQGDRSPVLRP